MLVVVSEQAGATQTEDVIKEKKKRLVKHVLLQEQMTLMSRLDEV